jgi:hypothetical protein
MQTAVDPQRGYLMTLLEQVLQQNRAIQPTAIEDGHAVVGGDRHCEKVAAHSTPMLANLRPQL